MTDLPLFTQWLADYSPPPGSIEQVTANTGNSALLVFEAR